MKHIYTKTILTVAALTFVGIISVYSEEKTTIDASKLPPASKQKEVTYAKEIKPIFDTSCTKCHHGEKPKGKLNLETLEGALKGGKEGKDIIPGKSAESPMVVDISYLASDEDLNMPPAHNKAGIARLTDEQVGLIRAWIDQGAK